MPALESHISTDRPARYVRQFRKHAEAMASPRIHRLRAHAGKQHSPTDFHLSIEGTDTHTTVRFAPAGTCTLTATDDTLTLHIEAPNPADLVRLRDLITADLTRFGRGTLDITWSTVEF
ncbi:DUF2218 domain-containing protein [Nocardia concava]|uniref:DUF2218 domain-containing protein n=1 Tax=Nocardia concava TaxID=257281 RepID=UPI0003111C22|nr:DUF2218 domain-containing protein [Nocardia concava]